MVLYVAEVIFLTSDDNIASDLEEISSGDEIGVSDNTTVPTLNTAWEGWSPMLERRRLSIISKRGSRTPNGKITAWEGKSPVLEIGKVCWQGMLEGRKEGWSPVLEIGKVG